MGSQREVRIIIAGGGTGGHLFPGIAVAKDLTKKFRETKVLFITGRRKMETELLTTSGFLHASIDIEGLKGRGWKKGGSVLLRLPISFIQSLLIIKKFSPHAVLGVGGYSAGPVCLTARILRIPTAIHEQNSFPGLTNRLLCKIVDRVFISFEESRPHFPGGSIFYTGNPVREELFQNSILKEKSKRGFTILVLGGSQGARAINRAFVDALKRLADRGRAPLVIHQTGERDHSQVLEGYNRQGLQGNIFPFIKDMAEAYGRADIVVSRAGATTVSELAALGKPAVLIPFPFAANNHQQTNAEMLVRVGGAVMILEDELTGDKLADLLTDYMGAPKDLENMARRAGEMGRRDSAGLIVDHLTEMMH